MITVPSFLLSLSIAISYVAVLYIHPADRPNGTYLQNRNNPNVIKRRMSKIVLITIIDMVISVYWISSSSALSYSEALLQVLGLYPVHSSIWGQIGFTLLSFCVLFIGPIIDAVLFDRRNLLVDYYKETFTSIQGFRNNIFAPMTEEIVYTACCLCVLSNDKVDWARAMYWVPAMFGIAHLHHGFEMYQQKTHNVIQILVTVMVQFTYTWLFGILTKKIFLDNGNNIWCCILAHSFCNFMGLPVLIPEERPGWWKYCYWMTLVLGLYGYYRMTFA